MISKLFNKVRLTRSELKNVSIGEEIRKHRDERCYSQDYLATQLGIKQSTYQRLEAGKISITMDRLEQIAQILDQPVEVFLLHDKMPQTNNYNGTDEQKIQINQREWDALNKMLLLQEKRIEELEAKLLKRETK